MAASLQIAAQVLQHGFSSTGSQGRAVVVQDNDGDNDEEEEGGTEDAQTGEGGGSGAEKPKGDGREKKKKHRTRKGVGEYSYEDEFLDDSGELRPVPQALPAYVRCGAQEHASQ